MKTRMFLRIVLCLALLALVTEPSKGDNLPASGSPDWQLELWEDLTAGSQSGAAVNEEEATVADDLFTMQLDFGDVADGNVGYTAPVPSDVTPIGFWQPITTTNAPVGRIGHTAVYTGSAMLVWGGYYYDGCQHYLNDGKRYNPTTNTWAAMASTTLAGRYGHTAVWTGSQMIVWGGYYYDGSPHYLNDGKQYNPTTNTWTDIAATNAPSARAFHTAVWTGSEMIVWGGVYQDGPAFHYLNNGKRYNPKTNTWADIAPTTLAGRSSHAAIWTGSEMIVWGGYSMNGGYLNDGKRYKPTTNTWTDMASTTLAGRVAHTAVWTGSEMIIWGGKYHDGSVFHYLSDGKRYKPTTNTWADIAPTTLAGRAAHTAVWTGAGMLVWGGQGDAGYLNDGERYNPVTNTWIAIAPTVLAGRRDHSAVWTGSEMIIWGGYYWGSSDHYLSDGARYVSLATLSVTPNSGWCKADAWRTFTTVYQNLGGWRNIRYADFLINSKYDETTRCPYFRYDVQANRMFLHHPTLDQWMPPQGVAPGSVNKVSNGYAGLNATYSSVVTSTDTLTITWIISFLDKSSGRLNNLYLLVKDTQGHTSGWNDHGDWAVNYKPAPIYLSPREGWVRIGEWKEFVTRYSDRDGRNTVDEVYLLLARSFGFTVYAVYLKYKQSTNEMWLRNAGDTAWLGPITPGSMGAWLENEYVYVQGHWSRSGAYDGKTLTVRWWLHFKVPFRGIHEVYMRAVDNMGAEWNGDTGWQYMGRIEARLLWPYIP